MENFSEKLKQVLKKKKLTQRELCEKIEMTPNGLKRMIDYNTVRVDTLEQICKVLDIDISYFIDVKIKDSDSYFDRAYAEMSEEMNKLRKRVYIAENLLAKNGILNFKFVSERRGVTKFKTQNRKQVSFLPFYLRFHLQK